MEYTIIYFILLVSILVYYIFSRSSGISILVLAVYVLIGLMSIICIKEGYLDVSFIRLWPYMLLVYSYVICIYPLKKIDSTYQKLDVDIDASIIRWFAIAYIILSLIAVYVLWPYVMKLLISKDWGTNRDYLYTNDVVIVRNIFEWLAVNFTSYLRIPALLVGFSIICLKKNKILGVLLLVCVTLCTSMKALYGSSRGILLDYILLFVAVFLVFRNWMSEVNRRYIIIILITLAVFALLYAVDVTSSRFGARKQFGENSAYGSLIYYFGHSPVIFNTHISRAKDVLLGQYGFGKLFSYFGIADTYSKVSLGIDWESNFYTYVGFFFIDWGILGTLAIMPLISLWVHIILTSDSLRISSLYSIFFYFAFLEQGAFVIGRFFSLELFVYFITLVMLIFYENLIKKNEYQVKKYKYLK